ncbi:MAG: hypothetical protein J6J42_02310 [Lachnospiraceae bacterium]|nr:hypothetical protein [Lachnospiraceae bacterium]
MAFFCFGYKRKLEEIKQLMEEEDYVAAALAADDIPLQKVKSAHELNILGKAYKKNGEFAQARDIFQRSYELRCSRTTLLDIMDCCLEVRDFEGVEIYFDEYHKVSPEDKVTQYIYRYRIEKKKERDSRLLIPILEELKALQYIEKYAYELAKQYHKAGMAQKCMEECNDIILWFGFGPTVERAKALLAYYKGEISLDEIRQVGAKYQAELERQIAEERERAIQEAFRQTETEIPQEQEVQKETSPSAGVEEEQEEEEDGLSESFFMRMAEQMEEEDREAEQEEEFQETMEQMQEVPEETEQEPDEFELPEIDLSCLGPELEEMSSVEETENEMPEEETYEPKQQAAEPVSETEADRETEAVDRQLKNFGRIERIRRQVVECLKKTEENQDALYYIVAGDAKTGRTTLALSMIRLFYEFGLIKYDRTAAIDAVQLNQVSIEDYAEELQDCNLIIENAGGMTRESADGLLHFFKNSQGSTCLFFEDNVRDINKLLRAREDLDRLFDKRVQIGKYTGEDLMGFVYDYIEKEDYSIEELAAQVLRNKTEEIVKEYSNEYRLERTRKMTEVVMARVEKRTGEQLLKMAAEGKIEQGDYLVITMEDVTP